MEKKIEKELEKYVQERIKQDRERSENFKSLFVGYSLLVLGVVGLFFEQSRGLSPLFIGFSIGFLGSVAVKKRKTK